MRTLLPTTTLLAGILTISAISANAAGTFTFAPFVDDASSGISSLLTYHSLANFGEPNSAVVNGVTFPGFNGGTTITGTNFTLSGANNDRSDDGDPTPSATSGAVLDLLNDFVFGTADLDANAGTEETSRLTLSNLAIGTTYRTTFYNAPFGSVNGRNVNVTASDGGSVLFDENFSAGANSANYLRYDFVAATATLTIDFDPASNGDTFHHYAFTNQVVPEPASIGLLGLGSLGLLARRRRA